MRIAFIALILICIDLLPAHAQTSGPVTNSNKPTLTWSGFVKAEGMLDTRQIVEAREGYLLFYPRKIVLDKDGNDINAHASFNQYAMTARITLKVAGPEVLGAKASALIEGDFTGASNLELNSLRLRHAYVKLQWNHASLLAGQYWHAINIPEIIPYVLSLNTGAPFHPFSRQPQIRFDANRGKLNAMVALSAQRDYQNLGPIGNSTTYLRNSVIPNLSGQVQYNNEKLFAGVGIDYKRLTPRIVTDSLYATSAAVNCVSYTGFVMLKSRPLIVKMQWIYGQGQNDNLLMGGYGVKHVELSTNQQEYTPLNYLSGWVNLQTTGNRWQGSFFAGYTKGFGSNDEITGAVYARDADIAYVYRFSPMLSYINGKLLLATEFEITTAAYGKPDSHYKVYDVKPVTNTRISFSIGYFF